jgi:hypothetical protein
MKLVLSALAALAALALGTAVLVDRCLGPTALLVEWG